MNQIPEITILPELKSAFNTTHNALSNGRRVDASELCDLAQAALQYIKTRFSGQFNKSNKQYSDEHIGEHLFNMVVEKKDESTWYKYQLFGVIKSYERLVNSLEVDGDSKREHIFLLKKFTMDTVCLLQRMEHDLNENLVDYGMLKSGVLSTPQVFDLSYMMFTEGFQGARRLGTYSIFPSSVLVLRQALELRIKNLLGILVIQIEPPEGSSELRRPAKIPGNTFLEVVKCAPEGAIDFPVKFSVVQKIYEWSNYFVHGGFEMKSWQIDWAFHLLSPLFSGGSHEGKWSRYGKVKVKKNFYGSIEQTVSNFLNSNCTSPKLYKVIKMDRPEALLVD